MQPREAAKRPLGFRERADILVEVYEFIEGQGKTDDGYSQLHSIVCDLTPTIEAKLGVKLPYEFEEENFFGPWDDQLQADIEALDFAGVIDNRDYPATGDVLQTHELHTTELARIRSSLREDSKSVGGKPYKEVRKVIQEALASDE